MVNNKYNFILKGLDIDEINKKYGFCKEEDEKFFLNETLLEETVIKPVSSPDTKNLTEIKIKEPEYISFFLDENKQQYKTVQTGNINNDVNCFWCKHKVEHIPLGCPIKWVNSNLEKNYTSMLNKEKYYIKENITLKKIEKIKNMSNNILSIPITVSETKNDYLLTDGIFCSFPCILAYINDNKHDYTYNESSSLLRVMYEKLTGESIIGKHFLPAPHWRLLSTYGGVMTIEEFRASFTGPKYEPIFTLDKYLSLAKPSITHFKLN
jgi:hypothetical protein